MTRTYVRQIKNLSPINLMVGRWRGSLFLHEGRPRIDCKIGESSHHAAPVFEFHVRHHPEVFAVDSRPGPETVGRVHTVIILEMGRPREAPIERHGPRY